MPIDFVEEATIDFQEESAPIDFKEDTEYLSTDIPPAAPPASIETVPSLTRTPAGSSEELSARNFYDQLALSGVIPTVENASLQEGATKPIEPLASWVVELSAGHQLMEALKDPAKQTTAGKIAVGTQTAIDEAVKSFASPLGIATLGIGTLPKMAQSLIASAFAAHMASTLPSQTKAAVEAIKAGDTEAAAKHITGTAITAGMVGLGGKHAFTSGKAAIQELKVESAKAVGPATEAAVTGSVTPAEAASSTPAPVERVTELEAPKAEIEAPKPAVETQPVGLGAATPAEFEVPPATTSIKNAVVDRERVSRGLPPAMEPAKRSFGTVWDDAMAKMDADHQYPDRLIAELREKPRAITDLEDATLLHRQVELQNEYTKAARDLAQAFDDGRLEDVAAEKVRVATLSDQLLDLYNINKAAGTETARGLNARKMLANEDFTLAKMELEKRAAKGGEQLTDAERAEVTELNRRIAETQKAYDDYVSKTDARIIELEIKRALDEAETAAKKEPTYPPEVLSAAERIVRGFEKRADAATIRLKRKLAQLGSAPDPTIIFDLAEIGVAKLGRAALDFTRWAAAMRLHLGEELAAKAEPFFKDAFEASGKMIESDLTKLDVSERVRRAVKKQDLKEQGDSIGDAIKRKVEAGQQSEITPQAQKLARLFVEMGVKDRNELIDLVHAELQKHIPEITRRDAMDAISGYGKFKQLTKDEISIQLRDLKGQMQQVGKLEDIQARKPPLKTGIERREPSVEERRLIKLVNDAKRRFGIVVTDPATQLRSALEARKTYYRNQIADLEAQIAAKEKLVKEKAPSPTDPELDGLKARSAALKEEFDAIFGKPGLSDAQRLEAMNKRAGELEARIAAGDIAPKPSTANRPLPPDLEQAKQRVEALNRRLAELRKKPESQKAAEQVAKTIESLNKRIAEKEAKLAAGDTSSLPQRVNRPATPEIEAAKQRLEQLNRELAELRKKPAEQRAADEVARKIEALNKRISEKESRIASGDVAPVSQRLSRPQLPGIEIAKQRLDALTKQIAELREAAKPKLTEEQAALKALKTRLQKNIDKFEDKLVRKDFTREPKRVIQLDAEAQRLHFKAAQTKAKWHEALMKDRLARRTVPQKILGGVGEVLNTTRAILTSLDLSAVLRQGGFITLGHPIRALKAFPAMFRALRSEAGQHAVNQEIMARKNYPLYQQSKLYLAEHGQKLSQMEEAYMSRWADKIPGVSHSQRAYVTFLNRLRADSFDAMANSLSRTGEVTPVEAKAIANFVNVATGRGKLGVNDNWGTGLSTIFFAPRYVASRFQLIGGQPFYKGNLRTRTAIAKEYARFLIGVGVFYGLAQMAGGDIETDPRSSDFGKVRLGDTRVDPLAGLQQVTVLLERTRTGETKKLSGKVVPIVGDVPYGQDDYFDVLSNFGRTKLSPILASYIDVRTGKDVVGRPVTLQSEALDLATPLALKDILKAMEDQGVPRGTALAILSIFGMGLQTYER